jgi:peroxidase
MMLTAAAAPVDTMTFAVPSGDAVFDRNSSGTKTMSSSRSNFDRATGSSAANPRQQLNSLTSFIDGSQVYGETSARASSLREMRGGRLSDGGVNLLPRLTNTSDMFLTGDVRGNENPQLCSLQVLFVREHNRVAAQIATANPAFSDEELYQRARRFVIALLQKVTYSEFLPAVLGSANLPPYSGYRSSVNPSISNEFGAAAFRLGHSMLSADVEFMDDNGAEVFPAMSLRDAFFNSGVLRTTGIEPVLKYLASDRGQEIDAKIIEDVRSFLFTNLGGAGHDLAALNIQRGRDHGLASYAEARVAYKLPPVSAFSQITSDLAVQNALKAAYGSVDKVELWVGGLAEQHLPGSSVGPLFAAILKDQFTRLRSGDRFWFQNAGVLARAQAAEVENTLLSDIIKRNTKLKNLQPLVFMFETSVAGVAFKDTNGDGQLTARAPAPPAPAGRKPAAPVSEPLLKNVPVSLIAADGSLAASGVTDSTGKFILRAQLDLGSYTLKSSLNPSVAMRVTLTKGGAVSGFSVPINAVQMSSAEEVSDADAEDAAVDGPDSSGSFFASQTNRAVLGGSAAACVVAGVVLGVVLKRRAARRRGLLPEHNEQAVSVPLDVVTVAV